MPAWITSLLRDDVTVPMPSAASSTITSRPACASRRATARPITPAPTTTHSTLSIRGSDPGFLGGLLECTAAGCVGARPWAIGAADYCSVGRDFLEQAGGV